MVELPEELNYLNYPPQDWVAKSSTQFDVVIIGAGMAGLAAAFALKRKGIERIQIYDRGIAGFEGPWSTYARMPTLRSTKELVGPAQELPALSFRAWYEARQGRASWETLGKIPTGMWMEYLRWYKQVLELPVRNNRNLKAIIPEKFVLTLQIDQELITTQKVVLATGRGGFGGIELPPWVDVLPKSCFSTAYEPIDFTTLRGKRLAVIGCGASGFDAASTALEQGSSEVDMIVRRKAIPQVNKAASNTYYSFQEGYFYLSDQERWTFQTVAYSKGVPPPVEALRRIEKEKNFRLYLDTHIEEVAWDGKKILFNTTKGLLAYDYLILATGFAIDGRKQPELAPFIDHILLWKDRAVAIGKNSPVRFLDSPYLGPHFQFLEKEEGGAPYLKNIYCYNYAATMSHGQLSGDIPGIGLGADRLARGIAVDLFTEHARDYLKRLEKYQSLEFNRDDFPFMRQH